MTISITTIGLDLADAYFRFTATMMLGKLY